MKLALGVLDMAYSDASAKGASTTGEVAEILEGRFHIMETFAEVYGDFIGEQIAQSLSDAVETIQISRRKGDPFAAAEQAIEMRFRRFLDDDEMSTIVAGLSPELRGAMGASANFSGAAQAGVNHRLKKPYAKENKQRPAFIDTGLYQASFRAWAE